MPRCSRHPRCSVLCERIAALWALGRKIRAVPPALRARDHRHSGHCRTSWSTLSRWFEVTRRRRVALRKDGLSLPRDRQATTRGTKLRCPRQQMGAHVCIPHILPRWGPRLHARCPSMMSTSSAGMPARASGCGQERHDLVSGRRHEGRGWPETPRCRRRPHRRSADGRARRHRGGLPRCSRCVHRRRRSRLTLGSGDSTCIPRFDQCVPARTVAGPRSICCLPWCGGRSRARRRRKRTSYRVRRAAWWSYWWWRRQGIRSQVGRCNAAMNVSHMTIPILRRKALADRKHLDRLYRGIGGGRGGGRGAGSEGKAASALGRRGGSIIGKAHRSTPSQNIPAIEASTPSTWANG